ncbi:fructose-bisphosphate aldolase [Lentzea sp. NBRC 105346]|nr:fructose-bisphosphate aldolase [Lentzea sp. NBRC 105346]
MPLDHSVSDGPVVANHEWDELIRDLVLGGADAIIVHKGRFRAIKPELLDDTALVVHLSAGTPHAADEHAKVLVGDAEDALRLGADAVSVHVNVGSDTESKQLADLGAVASSCQAWNIPLIAMIYARGPRIHDPRDSRTLAHVVNIAADLGADLVKTSMAYPVERMADVTASCPIPVLAAGGPPAHDPDGIALAEYARDALSAGCAGLAVGRRIFSSPNPLSVVCRLAAVLHPQVTPNHSPMTTGAGAA